jgi:hypothetical protein
MKTLACAFAFTLAALPAAYAQSGPAPQPDHGMRYDHGVPVQSGRSSSQRPITGHGEPSSAISSGAGGAADTATQQEGQGMVPETTFEHADKR